MKKINLIIHPGYGSSGSTYLQTEVFSKIGSEIEVYLGTNEKRPDFKANLKLSMVFFAPTISEA